MKNKSESSEDTTGIVAKVIALPDNTGNVTVELENGKIEKWLVGAIKILGVVDVVRLCR